MTCYAIQRPDGSLYPMTVAPTEREAWEWCSIDTELDLLTLRDKGYKCVRVTVTVEGE